MSEGRTYIEVTDEMREGVRRVKFAEENLRDRLPGQTYLQAVTDLHHFRHEFANLVIAAIEAKDGKGGEVLFDPRTQCPMCAREESKTPKKSPSI